MTSSSKPEIRMIIAHIANIWLLEPVVSPSTVPLLVLHLRTNEQNGASKPTHPKQPKPNTIPSLVPRRFASEEDVGSDETSTILS